MDSAFKGIRVAVVDDHAVVRMGLRQFLGEQAGMAVVAEAANGAAVVAMLRDGPVDVVVLDIAMPDRSGVEVLGQIKARQPDLPVLILSAHPASHYAEVLMRRGADAYLEKGCEPEEIVATILRLHRERGMPRAKPAIGSTDRAPHDNLSPHEFEIFLRLARGESNLAIGRGMALSPGTISKYRGRLMAKLRAGSNSELTYYAVKNGLL